MRSREWRINSAEADGMMTMAGDEQSAGRTMSLWVAVGGAVVLVVSAIFVSVIIRRRLAK